MASRGGWPETLGALAVIGILIFALVRSCHEEAEWEEFKRDHHCEVIYQQKSRVHHQLGNDDGMLVEPGQTCWKCDDGVEYCR